MLLSGVDVFLVLIPPVVNLLFDAVGDFLNLRKSFAFLRAFFVLLLNSFCNCVDLNQNLFGVLDFVDLVNALSFFLSRKRRSRHSFFDFFDALVEQVERVVDWVHLLLKRFALTVEVCDFFVNFLNSRENFSLLLAPNFEFIELSVQLLADGLSTALPILQRQLGFLELFDLLLNFFIMLFNFFVEFDLFCEV